MAAHTILDNWTQLNAHIVDANEAACVKLLKEELNGQRRRMFILRIHSRLNRVRADREREALMKAINSGKPVITWPL